MTKIFGILDTETNQFVTMPSEKCGWSSERAAKSAYTCHMGPSWYGNDRPSFKDQTRYKIIELTEAFYRLEGLEK